MFTWLGDGVHAHVGRVDGGGGAEAALAWDVHVVDGDRGAEGAVLNGQRRRLAVDGHGGRGGVAAARRRNVRH
ncbi:hypothetical protein TYRP_020024 [Tyrophagus putrescentiae]|nr:hypothetical protein TYRP_020024 [Tyrophagus putrescentiae]